MTVSDEEKMAQVMMQALQPLLQQFGLPPTLFEDLRRVKIKDFEIEYDKETEHFYASGITDAESVEVIRRLVGIFEQRLKKSQ